MLPSCDSSYSYSQCVVLLAFLAHLLLSFSLPPGLLLLLSPTTWPLPARTDLHGHRTVALARNKDVLGRQDPVACTSQTGSWLIPNASLPERGYLMVG